jgi:hypothetical protein
LYYTQFSICVKRNFTGVENPAGAGFISFAAKLVEIWNPCFGATRISTMGRIILATNLWLKSQSLFRRDSHFNRIFSQRVQSPRDPGERAGRILAAIAWRPTAAPIPAVTPALQLCRFRLSDSGLFL